MGYKATINNINCSLDAYDDEGFSMDLNNYSAGDYSLYLSCPDGYIFVTAPVISYIDSAGFEDTETFNKRTDTDYYLDIYLSSDCIIDAVAKVNRQYLSINTPDNTSVNVTDTNGFIIENDSLEKGNTYNIKVIPAFGYLLNSGTLTYTDSDGFEESTDLTEGAATVTPYSNITLTVNVEKDVNVEWHIENNLVNASYVPEKVYMKDVTRITITANDNYYFKEKPSVSYQGDEGFYIDIPLTKVSDTVYYCETPSVISQYPSWMMINGTAETDTPITDKYGIIKVFNPTVEELQAIAKKRFITATSAGVSIIDLGEYISKLFKLYCNVNTGGKADVSLAGYDLDVKADVVTQYETIVDCGRITIEGFYNNALDYTDTIIEIFVPFVGDRTLEPVKVMNERIRLVYKVNIITGDCVAFITNGAGDTIYKFNGSMSFKIPYILNDGAGYREKDISDTDLSLMGFVPTVTVRSKKALNITNTIQNNYKRDIIANFNGYHEFTDFFIDNVYIVDDEKRELKELLESGVII